MSTDNASAVVLEVVPLAMSFIRSEMRGLARPELSVAQFRVLARLNQEPQTNAQLADWIGISAPSMSRTVDTLVKRGLVSRQTDRFDRREVQLTLTSSGQRKFGAIKEAVRIRLDEKLRGLSADKRAKLVAGLAVLRGVIET